MFKYTQIIEILEELEESELVAQVGVAKP